MASERLVFTYDTLTPGLKAFPDKMNAAVAATIDYFTPVVEGYARQNAPWTDRTGNARGGLHATAVHEGNTSHAIELAHSVPYGIWLEVRWDGRYAIIKPTIESQGKVLMKTLSGILGRLR